MRASRTCVVVSDNGCTIKFFNVYIRGAKGVDGLPKHTSEAGTLRLDMPVNRCASPLSAIPPITVGLGPL
jgi:hypothetical protein